MEQLGKVLLVPLQRSVEMGIGEDLTGQQPTILPKDLHSPHLELVLLGRHRVVQVVVEIEHRGIMRKTVCLVCLL